MKRRIASLEERLFLERLPPELTFTRVELVINEPDPDGIAVLSIPIRSGMGTHRFDLSDYGHKVVAVPRARHALVTHATHPDAPE